MVLIRTTKPHICPFKRAIWPKPSHFLSVKPLAGVTTFQISRDKLVFLVFFSSKPFLSSSSAQVFKLLLKCDTHDFYNPTGCFTFGVSRALLQPEDGAARALRCHSRNVRFRIQPASWKIPGFVEQREKTWRVWSDFL